MTNSFGCGSKAGCLRRVKVPPWLQPHTSLCPNTQLPKILHLSCDCHVICHVIHPQRPSCAFIAPVHPPSTPHSPAFYIGLAVHSLLLHICQRATIADLQTHVSQPPWPLLCFTGDPLPCSADRGPCSRHKAAVSVAPILVYWKWKNVFQLIYIKVCEVACSNMHWPARARRYWPLGRTAGLESKINWDKTNTRLYCFLTIVYDNYPEVS